MHYKDFIKTLESEGHEHTENISEPKLYVSFSTAQSVLSGEIDRIKKVMAVITEISKIIGYDPKMHDTSIPDVVVDASDPELQAKLEECTALTGYELIGNHGKNNFISKGQLNNSGRENDVALLGRALKTFDALQQDANTTPDDMLTIFKDYTNAAGVSDLTVGEVEDIIGTAQHREGHSERESFRAQNITETHDYRRDIAEQLIIRAHLLQRAPA